MTRRKTNEEFVLDVKDLVGDEYIFLEEYTTSQTKIEVRHNKCQNMYSVSPSNFLRGYRCPFCSKRPRWDTEKMKNYLLENGIQLELLEEYTTDRKNTLVRCLKCGHEYKARPNNIKQGFGCPSCAKTLPYTLETIKEKAKSIKNGEYTFIDNVYTGSKHKHLVRHEVCGYEWKVLISNFLFDTRCPDCYGVYESSGVSKIKQYLKERDINYLVEYIIDDLRSPIYNLPLRFDFYIPEFDIYIEFDGVQHFQDSRKYRLDRIKLYDKVKNEYCERNSLDLLRINYLEEDQIPSILDKKFNGKRSTTIQR